MSAFTPYNLLLSRGSQQMADTDNDIAVTEDNLD